MNQPTKVITGKCRASFLNVFQPKSINGSDPKYSVSLIIPKTDKKTIDKVNAAIEAAKELGKEKWNGKIPPVLKTPLRDGDEERPDDAVYKNSYFVNATAKQQPGMVDQALNPIMDSTELYSGCYIRASLNFYPFSVNGNKGIACGLNNVQKLADGDPLGGRSRAEDDFDSVEDDVLG